MYDPNDEREFIPHYDGDPNDRCGELQDYWEEVNDALSALNNVGIGVKKEFFDKSIIKSMAQLKESLQDITDEISSVLEVMEEEAHRYNAEMERKDEYDYMKSVLPGFK